MVITVKGIVRTSKSWCSLPFQASRSMKFKTKLDARPKGKTPLAEAVRQAAESLRYSEDAATVVLITDGLETCSGDPCQLAKDLEANGIDFTAHVVGFDLTEEEGRQISCVAKNTGGQYIAAQDEEQLVSALTKTVVVKKPDYVLRCESYAQEAVSEDNINRGDDCGYAGLRWSADFGRHLDWCNSHLGDQAQLDIESSFRHERLAYCSKNKDKCRDYANQALEQVSDNQRQACGYTGGGWSNEFSRHYSYCMNRLDFAEATLASQERVERLSYCQTNLFACQDYANLAMDAGLQNTAHSCGFQGETWLQDFDLHFNSCMASSDMNEVLGQQNFRQQRLQFCVNHKHDCDAYATDAVADAVQSKTMTCELEGQDWDDRYETHYEFCMHQGSLDTLTALTDSRKQALATCQAKL